MSVNFSIINKEEPLLYAYQTSDGASVVNDPMVEQKSYWKGELKPVNNRDKNIVELEGGEPQIEVLVPCA